MKNDKINQILLSQEEIPKQWYNIQPDLPEPLPPPIDGTTGVPPTPEKIAQIFALPLLGQEMDTENQYIDIPEGVLEAYVNLINRPTPLVRAKKLEEYLKTPAEIYFKNESLNPAGSHKPNTAIPQIYYAMKEGLETMSTETGAGQWGTAVAMSCSYFGIASKVFMVRASYDQKPGRRTMMELFGGKVTPSPSMETEAGKNLLKQDKNHPGSLGVAISEALEYALSHDNTKYCLGSVLNHVMLHQTIIGQETQLQFKSIDKYPDILIGCVGGGSNFAGFSYPFIKDKLKGNKDITIRAVEPKVVPKLTRPAPYEYDYADEAELTFKLKMNTMGHKFIPPPIHAGGLRYHGNSPSLCLLAAKKVVEAVAYNQHEIFEAGKIFTRTQGIIPAPETCHAIKATIDEALRCKETGENKVIAFNFSGHGLLDLAGYKQYMEGTLPHYKGQ
ncbi:MAG: TrpB-like pyridoxal phosphate-dependent enzyme [Candidatus Ranarchaeia archaeon]